MFDQMIKTTFDVVGTSGDEYICRCPWHQDGNKPNLYVNAKKGLYICHSCGAKGHLRSLGGVPALATQHLRARVTEMTKKPEPLKVYSEGWLRQFDHHHEAWDERLTQETQDKFGLGYDPFNDVLTIPIRDGRGRLLGIITRRLDDLKPKYRYPKGFKTSHYLFGAWLLKKRHRKVAIVEGSVDAMACWDARVPALALMGARLSEQQRAVLKRSGVSHVVLMLDNDKPGRGWPTHPIKMRRLPGGRYLCEGCDRTFDRPAKGEHPSAGAFQVYEMLEGTGIMVSVGEYRPYWSDKDPAALSPTRRRKMYHSAKPWHAWLLKMA